MFLLTTLNLVFVDVTLFENDLSFLPPLKMFFQKFHMYFQPHFLLMIQHLGSLKNSLDSLGLYSKFWT